jgi:transcription factor IIIB subunit 2
LKAISDDKDEDDLYTMSVEDENGEEGGASLVIIEEEAGSVASPSQSKSRKVSETLPVVDDVDNGSGDEKYDDEKYEDEDGWGEEDMYEQEI